MKIAIIDIETTGFIVTMDAIVEIGIVLVDTDTKEITKIFDSVVKDKNFNPKIHNNSWIFDNSDLVINDVINAEPLEMHRATLQTIFDTYYVTAFNKAFDLRFLRSRGFTLRDITCLMKSGKSCGIVLYENGEHKPPSVEEAYSALFPDEYYVEAHRGGDDAMHEAKILLKLCDIKAGLIKVKPIIISEQARANKKAIKNKKMAAFMEEYRKKCEAININVD
jgi:DNA polymerase-3 subunit epsilon